MDRTYLYAYSVDNMLNKHLNDRFPIRLVVPMGMLLASVSYFLTVALVELRVVEMWSYIVLWGSMA